jgi:hypothetical protein
MASSCCFCNKNKTYHLLEDLSEPEVPVWATQFQKGQSILRERSNAGPSCVRAWLGCVLTSTLAPAQAVSRGLVLLAPSVPRRYLSAYNVKVIYLPNLVSKEMT